MPSFTFTIPEVAPSLNKVLRTHWSDVRRLKAYWARLIWLERLERRADMHPPFVKAKVSIVRQSLKQLDTDNLYGSAKVILDALVSNGVIEDDSPDHIELTVTQQHGKPTTVISVASETP